jgi:hypothetical protein
MHAWTPGDMMLTTFSIMMINYGSRGRLAAIQGPQAFRPVLQPFGLTICD